SHHSLRRLGGLRPTSLAGPVRNIANETIYIPRGGDLTVNYDRLRAPLQEGELFGEISCLYRTPRSATVVARRDCYMLEMLRNILDQIQRDPVYKARSDEIYKQRVWLDISKLSLFADLTEGEFNEIKDSLELLNLEPGALLFDEGEASDNLY